MYEKDKRSFFEKLTGTINIEEEEENNIPIGEEKPERIKINDQNEEEEEKVEERKVPTSVSINQYEKEEETEDEV
ncbi:MAG: hypothetical protein KAI72_06755, partial [Candidatus Pacebacteria bacterium]|nr:hypothetical protein [Candidatus Paceibacterota bacterium]